MRRIRFLFKLLGKVDGISKLKLIFMLAIRVIFSIHVPTRLTVSVDGKKAQLLVRGTLNDFSFLMSIWDEEYAAPITNPVRIVDLGAHVGIASVWFLLKHPEARVEAFEPSPELFPILEKNLAQFGQRAKAYQMAAAGHDGKMTLYLADENTTTKTSTACRHVGNSVEVECKSLDAIVGDEPVDILKMDIEGSEYELIKNAAHLSKIRYILGELHDWAYPNRSNDDFFRLLEPSHKIIRSTDIFIAQAV